MEFHFPQQVHLGQGVSQRFGLAAKEAGASVLLLADGAFDGSKELGILTHSLDRVSLPYLVVAGNPRQGLSDALTAAVTVAKASRMDVLAALGDADQLALGRAVMNELSKTQPFPYFEVPSAICYPLLLRSEVFLSTGHPADVRFVPFSAARHQIFVDP